MKVYRQLPSTLYMVRVPIIATYTEEEIAIYGLPVEVTKGKRNNTKAYQDMTVVSLPLSKIIDIYSNGFPISLVVASQTKEIFDILEQYLQDYVTENYSSPNARVVQDDRLEDIDRFVSEIFGHNRVSIIKERVAAPSGYGLNINLLGTNGGYGNNQTRIRFGEDDTRKEVAHSGGSGITAAYMDAPSLPNPNGNQYVQQQFDNTPQQNVQQQQMRTYLPQTQAPIVDVTKVERKTAIKDSGSLNHLDVLK